MQRLKLHTLFVLFTIIGLVNSTTGTTKPRDTEKQSLNHHLTQQQVENLYQLGLIWGFLKYHHPEIRSGKLDWDKELLDVFPKIASNVDSHSNQEMLADWVASFGIPESYPTQQNVDQDIYLQPDNDWANNINFLGERLSQNLNEIYNARHAPISNHYVSFQPRNKKAIFENEIGYKWNDFDRQDIRLLTLFRYWNAIQYWFPYRDMIPRDWKVILKEYLQKISEIKTKYEYLIEMSALVAEIKDSHGGYLDGYYTLSHWGSFSLGIDVERIENQWIVVKNREVLSQAQKEELNVGDVIVSIDGRTPEALADELKPFCAASNNSALYKKIGMRLSSGKSEHCEITVERNGETFDLLLTRNQPKKAPPPFYRVLNGTPFQLITSQIAYIKLSEADNSKIDEYLRLMANTKGVIIDIRCYPKDPRFSSKLAGHFIKKKTTFAMTTHCDPGNPGRIIWGEKISIEPKIPHYSGKIVVLVNSATISNSEFQAMCFQSTPNCTVIGSQTMGADGNVTSVPISDLLSTTFSGIGIFYPDKSPAQQVGIIPDIAVSQTIESIRSGKDLVMEEAIRNILSD